MGPYKKQKKSTPLSDEALKRFDKELPQRRSDWYTRRSHSDEEPMGEERENGNEAAADDVEPNADAVAAVEAPKRPLPHEAEDIALESKRMRPSEVPGRLRFSENDPEVQPRPSSPRMAELRAQAIEEAKANHETAADRRKSDDFRTAHRDAVKAKLRQPNSKWDGDKKRDTGTGRRLPIIGILELLGGIAIIVVGIVLISKFTRSDRTTVTETTLEEEVPFANVPGPAIEKILDSFFHCNSVDEMLPFVRHPEVVEPKMREWYAEHPIQPTAIEIVNSKEGMVSDGVINAPDQLWVTVATVRRADSSKIVPVMVERTEHGWKVDWESTAGISETAFVNFVAHRPTTEGEFRVKISPDDYYNYHFDDDSQWTCYRVSSQHDGASCFGYVARGGAVEAKLKDWFYPGETGIPIIATLKFPPKSDGSVAEITDVTQKNWIKRYNPTQPK